MSYKTDGLSSPINPALLVTHTTPTPPSAAKPTRATTCAIIAITLLSHVLLLVSVLSIAYGFVGLGASQVWWHAKLLFIQQLGLAPSLGLLVGGIIGSGMALYLGSRLYRSGT